MEWLLGFSLRDQALDGAPARAVGSFPASRLPLRTQLDALNPQATCPLFLKPCISLGHYLYKRFAERREEDQTGDWPRRTLS